MPLTIGDPSLRAGIVTQSTQLFDYPNTPAPSILNFQAVPTQPLPDRTSTATGLLAPDLLMAHWLTNFPPDLYDMTPSSALTHFLSALMGDSGAGQLRKLQTVARLQSAVTGSNFYDLDAFYGAIFGALRGPDGTLPVNPSTGATFSPYTDVASNDAWDDIYAIDAVFRERVIALARAIALGATVPGMQAIAEAITGVPCFVFETWRLIDAQGAQGGLAPLWSVLQARYPTWDSMPDQTWDQLSGIEVFGGLGLNARNEIIIQPRRYYDSTLTGQQQQAADTFGILKVAEVLKPASALVSVNILQAQVDTPVQPRSLWSDSEYWEVVPHVTPPDPSAPAYAPTVQSYQRGGHPITVPIGIPRPAPPFSQSQGCQYSYVSDITSVIGQSCLDGDFNNPTNLFNYETHSFPTAPPVTWLPSQGVMDPAKAASARSASPVATMAAPYTGPRVPVSTAT